MSSKDWCLSEKRVSESTVGEVRQNKYPMPQISRVQLDQMGGSKTGLCFFFFSFSKENTNSNGFQIVFNYFYSILMFLNIYFKLK